MKFDNAIETDSDEMFSDQEEILVENFENVDNPKYDRLEQKILS